jgi:hypothetical protein
MSRKCGFLDFSQTYGFPRPVAGTALLFLKKLGYKYLILLSAVLGKLIKQIKTFSTVCGAYTFISFFAGPYHVPLYTI